MADGKWRIADGRWPMTDSRWQCAISDMLSAIRHPPSAMHEMPIKLLKPKPMMAIEPCATCGREHVDARDYRRCAVCDQVFCWTGEPRGTNLFGVESRACGQRRDNSNESDLARRVECSDPQKLDTKLTVENEHLRWPRVERAIDFRTQSASGSPRMSGYACAYTPHPRSDRSADTHRCNPGSLRGSLPLL